MTDFTVLFFNKRTGSTFLQNAINSHPDLFGCDECFVNICKKSTYRKSGFIPFVRPEHKYGVPEEYIRNYIMKENKNKKAVCMKIAYNQIHFHHGLYQYILHNRIPMIHLQRRNLVKQIVSGMNAAYQNHNPIKVSPLHLLNLVQEAKTLNDHWENQLKSQIKLTLYYEDIIGVTDGDRTYVEEETNKKICDFFDISWERLYAKTKKKNKNDLSVYLPNIEEIKKAFKGTQFLWMLN